MTAPLIRSCSAARSSLTICVVLLRWAGGSTPPCRQRCKTPRKLYDDANGIAVMEAVLPEGSTFTVPWNLVYDTYLDSSIDPRDIPVCPIVKDLPSLRDTDARRCPRADEVDHAENLLCPFGFWGLRHSLEILTSTERPKRQIVISAPERIIVGRAHGGGIDRGALDRHLVTLGQLFDSVEAVDSKADLRSALAEADPPFLYFFCHGDADADNTTRMLTIGQRDQISPADVIGWIDVEWRRSKRRMWTNPQPLVFINACASLAIKPEDLVDYLGAFVGRGNARRRDRHRGARHPARRGGRRREILRGVLVARCLTRNRAAPREARAARRRHSDRPGLHALRARRPRRRFSGGRARYPVVGGAEMLVPVTVSPGGSFSEPNADGGNGSRAAVHASALLLRVGRLVEVR